ncbi:hypothetical protein VHAB30_09440 [Variovorax boronicumulans]|nr:hypothetical protein VHAB30_09440 [Variovorax boronicumulans]
MSLFARNANSLSQATAFHFEAGGFPTEKAARDAGEALRIKLRVLNALLGLGLLVPQGDKQSASVSTAVKDMASKEGGVIIDTIWGVQTYPDDGLHGEIIIGGNLEVNSSDPLYVFEAISKIWPIDVKLDAPSEIALHILGLGTTEASEKASFLTSYLAIEQLIERKSRSEKTKKLLIQFQRRIQQSTVRKRAPMDAMEAKSLSGALSALQEESFSSALTRFAKTLKTPTEIRGIPKEKFFSACIQTRNKIAHQVEVKTKISISELNAGLREITMGLIWHRNNLPSITINTPPSKVLIPEGQFAIRVL